MESKQGGRTRENTRFRSASPRPETGAEEGATKKVMYRDILNIREEPTTKVDRLMKEAMGCNMETVAFNEKKITKVTSLCFQLAPKCH